MNSHESEKIINLLRTYQSHLGPDRESVEDDPDDLALWDDTDDAIGTLKSQPTRVGHWTPWEPT